MRTKAVAHSSGHIAQRQNDSKPREAFSRLIARALRRRCPVCGRGAMFRSHFRMNRNCPSCHVLFWKDPGESLGAMYLDYAVAAASFLSAWMLISLTTAVSQLSLIITLSAVAVTGVLVLYPWSRCIWTVLVYISGGIERPPMRSIRGGKPPS